MLSQLKKTSRKVNPMNKLSRVILSGTEGWGIPGPLPHNATKFFQRYSYMI